MNIAVFLWSKTTSRVLCLFRIQKIDFVRYGLGK
jgi:hypothetical protein